MNEILTEVSGGVGRITLNRPKALNALSRAMILALTAVLRGWMTDPAVHAVAVRGQGREGPFGAFCAGGDIRFFHEAALAGDPALDAYFTEEYALDHLIHHYPKPFIAFMDGVVMGGGMGISQGARLRLVSSHTRMAMPETAIGLFPDVGGGWFLARCPGHSGMYLALTGAVIAGDDAVWAGLADRCVSAGEFQGLWDGLTPDSALAAASTRSGAAAPVHETVLHPHQALIDRHFGLDSVGAIVASLEASDDDWCRATAALLRKRSPLMLHVVFEQLTRARTMSLADELRMERDMVHHCFHLRPGAASETVEGIRALAVDKDHRPRWNPARIEEVDAGLVQAFFVSPWPAAQHPLAALRDD